MVNRGKQLPRKMGLKCMNPLSGKRCTVVNEEGNTEEEVSHGMFKTTAWCESLGREVRGSGEEYPNAHTVVQGCKNNGTVTSAVLGGYEKLRSCHARLDPE